MTLCLRFLCKEICGNQGFGNSVEVSLKALKFSQTLWHLLNNNSKSILTLKKPNQFNQVCMPSHCSSAIGLDNEFVSLQLSWMSYWTQYMVVIVTIISRIQAGDEQYHPLAPPQGFQEITYDQFGDTFKHPPGSFPLNLFIRSTDQQSLFIAFQIRIDSWSSDNLVEEPAAVGVIEKAADSDKKGQEAISFAFNFVDFTDGEIEFQQRSPERQEKCDVKFKDPWKAGKSDVSAKHQYFARQVNIHQGRVKTQLFQAFDPGALVTKESELNSLHKTVKSQETMITEMRSENENLLDRLMVTERHNTESEAENDRVRNVAERQIETLELELKEKETMIANVEKNICDLQEIIDDGKHLGNHILVVTAIISAVILTRRSDG